MRLCAGFDNITFGARFSNKTAGVNRTVNLMACYLLDLASF